MKFFVCICVSIFLSCRTSKQPIETEKELTIKQVSSEERICFINLKIEKDSVSNVSHIEVINTTVAIGHLKDNGGGAVRSKNYLTCILYEDNRVSDTVVLQHPLYRIYEYMNENNQLMLKETDQKKAVFSLRFQLKGKTAQVKIVETLQGNSNQQEIALINL